MYPCVHVPVCVCVHLHAGKHIFLSSAWEQQHFNRHEPIWCPTLGFKIPSSIKMSEESLEKWLIPQLGPGSEKMSLEHLVVLESEDMLKE